MSSDHPDTGPATASGNPLTSILDAGTKLISPREHAEAPTVVTNIGKVIATTYDAAKQTVATTIDLPLGVVEATVAGVNNAVGTMTTFVDKGIVQQINKFRAGMSNVLRSPSKILAA